MICSSVKPFSFDLLSVVLPTARRPKMLNYRRWSLSTAGHPVSSEIVTLFVFEDDSSASGVAFFTDVAANEMSATSESVEGEVFHRAPSLSILEARSLPWILLAFFLHPFANVTRGGK
jgi:hypothetical protein